MGILDNWPKHAELDTDIDETQKTIDEVVFEYDKINETPIENNVEENEIKRRTPTESENDLVAPYLTYGYDAQISTKTNENGEIEIVPWGEKGSRRPDAINLEENAIVEVKNYTVTNSSGRGNLVRNIKEQTADSIRNYGDGVKITEVIDVKGQDVTVGDMEKLTKKLEEKVPEIDIDYRW